MLNTNIRTIFFYKILPFFIFFLAFVAMSPILAFFGLRGIFTVSFILSVTVIFTFILNIKVKKIFLYLCLLLLLTSFIPLIYWSEIKYLGTSIFIITAIFLFTLSDSKVIENVINIATLFIFVIVLGAVIGFVLAFVDFPYLFDLPNPDGRSNYFYYTTFTNAKWGNIIRPSGIYDEPGALSFYTCSIAALRQLFNRSSKVTWIILIIGLITFSLAHLIYMFFYLISEKFSTKNISTLFFIISISAIIIYSIGFYDLLEDKLFSRIKFSQSLETIEGDNRSFQMNNIIDFISRDKSIIFFGAHSSCIFDYVECKSRFEWTDSNPLSPLFYRGIFISWPYYIALVYLFSLVFYNRRYFITFGFALLLLQRPELLTLPGSMTSVLIIGTSLRFINNKIDHKRLSNLKSIK